MTSWLHNKLLQIRGKKLCLSLITFENFNTRFFPAKFQRGVGNFGVMSGVGANAYAFGYVTLAVPLANGYKSIARLVNSVGKV